jgi:membrane associated rhomboid family serine protease
MTDFRPRSFSILPIVIKNLLIINGLIFLAQVTFEHNNTFNIDNFFALHDVHSVYFKPHQLITHLFMHGSFMHLFVNMFALWMFGSTLENYWGAKRFLLFYMVCGLGAAFLHLGVLYFENAPVMDFFHQLSLREQEELLYAENFRVNVATVGASGAVFGCLAAFGYLFPNSLIYIYGLFPLKAKWLVLIYAGIELYSAIENSAGDNVAHWAHLGGALAGIILVWIWNKRKRRNFY